MLSYLPAVNATLNGSAAALLLTGYILIRRDRRDAHRLCMILALCCSALFLISYLVYHYAVGTTRFTGTGLARTVYFIILWTHTPLAMVIVPMVILTVKRALGERFDAHRRIARWTLPLWLYVSVTGLLIYFMLYQWFPPQP